MKKFIMLLFICMSVGCNPLIFKTEKLTIIAIEKGSQDAKHRYKIHVPASISIYYESDEVYNIGDEVKFIKAEKK